MKLINEKQAAIMLNCSIYKLQKDRVTGNFLPFIKIGRNVRYLKSDIEGYIKNQRFSSTSEYQLNKSIKRANSPNAVSK